MSITLEELDMVRRLYQLGHAIGHDDATRSNGARKADEDEARELLERFADSACSHDYRYFAPLQSGAKLKRCAICHTTRIEETEK